MVKKNSKKPSQKKRMYIVAGIILFLLIAFDVSPFGGNAEFYTKWIQCGKKPLATAGSGYLNSGVSHYYQPSSFPGSHSAIEYFCTPLEAEKAGYSANSRSYDFPHLNNQ